MIVKSMSKSMQNVLAQRWHLRKQVVQRALLICPSPSSLFGLISIQLDLFLFITLWPLSQHYSPRSPPIRPESHTWSSHIPYPRLRHPVRTPQLGGLVSDQARQHLQAAAKTIFARLPIPSTTFITHVQLMRPKWTGIPQFGSRKASNLRHREQRLANLGCGEGERHFNLDIGHSHKHPLAAFH
jgi:hypothetical protein